MITKFVTDAEILNIIQQVVDQFLIPKFNVLGMNATGRWLQSLEVGARDSVGVIRGESYTEFLTKGRRPNENQDPKAKAKWAFGMANNNPQFKAWLQARGLVEYGVQIAYKIADKGTTWHEKGGTDLIEMLNERQVIDFINNKITIIINERLERELKNLL